VRGIASGITTAAFVLSTDIFTSVSVQQTNEEANIQNIGVQYFDSEDEAIKWLVK
jgi:hypothetical protein